MPDETIPDDVRAFILAHIESVLQLEVLLLVHGQSQRQWTAADVAQEMRIDPQWVSAQMAGLTSAGVLGITDTSPPAYRYQPRTAEIDAAVGGLAREYAARRVTVIGLIFSKPPDKLRSFADAFRIRKDKPDG